jgi:hypothetical protein
MYNILHETSNYSYKTRYFLILWYYKKKGVSMKINSTSNVSFKGSYLPSQVLLENKNFVQKLISEHDEGKLDFDTFKKVADNYEYNRKADAYLDKNFPIDMILEDVVDEDKNLRLQLRSTQSDYIHPIDGVVFRKNSSPTEWFANFKQLYKKLTEINKYEIGVKMFQMRRRYAKLQDFISPQFLLKDVFGKVIER